MASTNPQILQAKVVAEQNALIGYKNIYNGSCNDHRLSSTLKKYETNVLTAKKPLEAAKTAADPNRGDLTPEINLILKDLSLFNSKLEHLSTEDRNTIYRWCLIIVRTEDVTKEGNRYLKSCIHKLKGKEVKCDCIPNDTTFLVFSENTKSYADRQRLLTPFGQYIDSDGNCTYSKDNLCNGPKDNLCNGPTDNLCNGPTDKKVLPLEILREWSLVTIDGKKKLGQTCTHYHNNKPVDCNCIKTKTCYGFDTFKLSTEGEWGPYIKNGHYKLDPRTLKPISIRRYFLQEPGHTLKGGDKYVLKCSHNSHIKDYDTCDCTRNSNGTLTLSKQMQKFQAAGLIDFTMPSTPDCNIGIIIERRFAGFLIPTSQVIIDGFIDGFGSRRGGPVRCYHTYEDGRTSTCDCPLKNGYLIYNHDEKMFEISDNIKEKIRLGRQVKINNGNIAEVIMQDYSTDTINLKT